MNNTLPSCDGSIYAAIPDIQTRRRAFLKDTAEFYNSNNRAVEGADFSARCVYHRTNNSPGCAIGRFCAEPEEMPIQSIRNFNHAQIIEFVPNWMFEMGVEFLFLVQTLHDAHLNWYDKGIRPVGKCVVNEICNEYNLIPIYEIQETQSPKNP